MLRLSGGSRLSPDSITARKPAATAPLWRPGETFGYHALTIGIIMEEVCRRVAGGTIWHEQRRGCRGLDHDSGLDNGFAVIFMKPHPGRNGRHQHPAFTGE